MRALVTGAAGFIGSHLADALLIRGWNVLGVDDLTDTYPPATKRVNLRALLAHPRFAFHAADLGGADLGALLDGVDVVAHLAGEPGVTASWGDSFGRYVDRNVLATQRLLEAVATTRIGRLVYASSSSVYGEAATAAGRAVDESVLPRPVSPYGVSKLAGELLVGAYAAARGLPGVSLRYFSVYGPRQRPDMAMYRFTEAILDGLPVKVYGDGGQLRDFTYVADVVAATVAALTADVRPGAVFNIASGSPTAVGDVIRLIGEYTNVEPMLDYRPTRCGDVARTEGSTHAARRELGWRPVVELTTGLARQVEWHLARRGLVDTVRAVSSVNTAAADRTADPGVNNSGAQQSLMAES